MAVFEATWPPLLIPMNAEFMADMQSRSGGQSISGVEQIVRSDAGRWRCSMEIPLRKEDRILALRAFLAQLEGRLGTVLVPKWDRYRPRNINGRRFGEVGTASYDDCSLNFDLSGFGQEDNAQGTVAANAALGATRITANFTDGEGPRPGHFFGIGQRLYQVQQTWQEDVGDPVTIQFWPTLRVAAMAGDGIILDRPVCLMRLTDDGSGQGLSTRRQSGSIGLSFVEVF